ncbi:MAG: hypothetical protein JTT11_07420 [Candidatus Brockarchaeota archaeon]|nr:hypothetical protein [Candidatus Brockarchaeota archaeon]
MSFVVLMASLLVAIAASFVLPAILAVSIPFLAAGAWLMALGFASREAEKGAVASARGIRVFWGGTIVTLSIAYLLHALGFEIRFLLMAFVSGILLAVVLTYFSERGVSA